MKKKRDKEVAAEVSKVMKSPNPPSAPTKKKRKRKPAAEESASDDEDEDGIEINNEVSSVTYPSPLLPPSSHTSKWTSLAGVFLLVKSLPMKTTVRCS